MIINKEYIINVCIKNWKTEQFNFLDKDESLEQVEKIVDGTKVIVDN